jgi:hypothetical protein
MTSTLFALLAFMLLGSAACRQAPTQSSTSGYLNKVASQTKARGETSVRLRDLAGLDTESSLDQVLSESAVVIGSVGKSQLEVTGDSIFTWQYLTATEWLRRRNTDPRTESCSVPPPATPNEVVLALGTGTARVDDVQITNANEERVSFEKGKRYLILGRECPGSYFTRPWAWHGVFLVNEDHSISLPPFNPGEATYAKQLIAMGTIDALRLKLQTK